MAGVRKSIAGIFQRCSNSIQAFEKALCCLHQNDPLVTLVVALPIRSGLVLFVADLFHPVGGLAVELFLNGDVRHGRSWRGAVPMFLTRREPDYITRPNVLDRTTPALYPAAASRHDQGLAQRVAVPCCPSAGLEGDAGAGRACWIGCLEQGVNAYRAGKILGRSFA
jgi:hypothetical protein